MQVSRPYETYTWYLGTRSAGHDQAVDVLSAASEYRHRSARHLRYMISEAAPAVSVIIPAYGVTPYIAEALDSVLAQTYTDFELIVVNDGCPDTAALEAVLRPYLDHIVYVKKENGGVSSARNAGIRVARAPLIALLDGDDAW